MNTQPLNTTNGKVESDVRQLRFAETRWTASKNGTPTQVFADSTLVLSLGKTVGIRLGGLDVRLEVTVLDLLPANPLRTFCRIFCRDQARS